MSSPKAEDTKPSRFIEIFWWIVFIIPVAFTWIATQSYLYVGILIGLRIVVMFIPKGWFNKAKPVEPKPTGGKIPVKKSIEPVIPESVITRPNPLTPYKDELLSEWKGLLKMLRIYDHDKEERFIEDYRKLRGWDDAKRK